MLVVEAFCGLLPPLCQKATQASRRKTRYSIDVIVVVFYSSRKLLRKSWSTWKTVLFAAWLVVSALSLVSLALVPPSDANRSVVRFRQIVTWLTFAQFVIASLMAVALAMGLLPKFYEPPTDADLLFDTSVTSIAEALQEVIKRV